MRSRLADRALSLRKMSREIASIYGMNFAFMPELKWHYGYLFAGLLMLASALLPLWYFKRRGWL